jgi:hypothetical protein
MLYIFALILAYTSSTALVISPLRESQPEIEFFLFKPRISSTVLSNNLPGCLSVLCWRRRGQQHHSLVKFLHDRFYWIHYIVETHWGMTVTLNVTMERVNIIGQTVKDNVSVRNVLWVQCCGRLMTAGRSAVPERLVPVDGPSRRNFGVLRGPIQRQAVF